MPKHMESYTDNKPKKKSLVKCNEIDWKISDNTTFNKQFYLSRYIRSFKVYCFATLFEYTLFSQTQYYY